MDSPASLPNALTLGALLATAISVLGFKRRWLTLSGCIASILIGTSVFAAGWIMASALLFLFLASAAIARYTRARPGFGPAVSHQQKPRTAVQVLAVGAVPAAAALSAEFGSCAACIPTALAALAFATSDTWATDVGMTAKTNPRVLGFGRHVASGMSGGMTLRGTLASLAGAVAIALIAAPFGMRTMLTVAIGGFAGSIVDSALGAALQSRYQCALCGEETEDAEHCSVPVTRARRGLSNAGVNFVTSAAIASLTYLVMK